MTLRTRRDEGEIGKRVSDANLREGDSTLQKLKKKGKRENDPKVWIIPGSLSESLRFQSATRRAGEAIRSLPVIRVLRKENAMI